MQLYYTPGTISVAVAIALNEAGIPYEPILVDFSSTEQRSPEFPKLTAFRELMASRPSVQTVVAQGML